jgi:hypothetical protein
MPGKKAVETVGWYECSTECDFDRTRVHAASCRPFEMPKALASQLERARKNTAEGKTVTRTRRRADFFEELAGLVEFITATTDAMEMFEVPPARRAAHLAGALLEHYEITPRQTSDS